MADNIQQQPLPSPQPSPPSAPAGFTFKQTIIYLLVTAGISILTGWTTTHFSAKPAVQGAVDDKSTRQAITNKVDQVIAGRQPFVVGEIRMFGMESAPPGWIECDGRALSDSEYSELFEVIGNRFGAGTQPNTFRVPDMRGAFPRGWNHGSNNTQLNDPDALHRTILPGSPSWQDSDHVGTVQLDEIKAHNHSLTLGGRWGDKTDNSYGWGSDNGPLPGDHPVSSSDVGGKETRPKNLYLMFCIRAA